VPVTAVVVVALSGPRRVVVGRTFLACGLTLLRRTPRLEALRRLRLRLRLLRLLPAAVTRSARLLLRGLLARRPAGSRPSRGGAVIRSRTLSGRAGTRVALG